MTKPIAIGKTEEAAESQISVGRDAATAQDYLADALGRNANLFRQTILGQSQRLQELFLEKFAGGYRVKSFHAVHLAHAQW